MKVGLQMFSVRNFGRWCTKMMQNEKDNMTLQEAALLYASRAAAFWILLSISVMAVLCLISDPTVALSVGSLIAAGGGGAMLIRGSRALGESPLDSPIWEATAPQSRPPVSDARRAVSEALVQAHHVCARFCAGVGGVLCVGGFFLA